MSTRRLLLSPLLLLIALTTILGAGTVSASAAHRSETRVRAIDTAVVERVGQPSSETPASVGCLRPSQPGLVSGSCVATEEGSILNFGSKAAAREGLTGDAGTAANRFFRDATSKSIDFQAQELSNGGYRLQFFSPANNPGYGKLYVQEIDAVGNVIKEFKYTLGPDGLIETKWVHGGP